MDFDPPAKKHCKLQKLLGDMFPERSNHAENLGTLELVKRDMAAYNSQPSAPLDANPLDWWKKNQTELPIISTLAAQILVVQGTSVPSERVFSTCGITVSDKRSRLTGDNVEHIVFLNKNVSLI